MAIRRRMQLRRQLAHGDAHGHMHVVCSAVLQYWRCVVTLHCDTLCRAVLFFCTLVPYCALLHCIAMRCYLLFCAELCRFGASRRGVPVAGMRLVLI